MKRLDISHIIPYDLLFATMEFMSKISAKSAWPSPLASLPIVSKDYSAKRPLPLVMLKLAPCSISSLPWSHKLFNPWLKHITVLTKFSPPYFPPESNILGLPSLLCSLRFQGDSLILSHSIPPSPFSSLPHFHRKPLPQRIFILSISRPDLSFPFAAVFSEPRAAPVAR